MRGLEVRVEKDTIYLSEVDGIEDFPTGQWPYVCGSVRRPYGRVYKAGVFVPTDGFRWSKHRPEAIAKAARLAGASDELLERHGLLVFADYADLQGRKGVMK